MEIKYDVSIIVPVYNRENLIKPCINSINTQTLDKSRWEVIFVDDASTDGSVEVIEKLIDKNINYRIIKREIPSGNASAPRNEGIKASLGKYVFFLDSDDYIDSKLLENGINIALKNDSDIVYFKIKGINRHATPRPFKKPIVDKADIFKDHLFRTLAPIKMFKTATIKDNSILFDVSIKKREDQLFCALIILYSKNISILADRDYYYAIYHEGGEHLSKSKCSLVVLEQAYINLLWRLSCSKKELDFKIKFYNGLIIRYVETFRDSCRKKDINNELEIVYKSACNYFNMFKHLFRIDQVYKNEQLLVLTFLSGDFKAFFELSNNSKILQDFCQKIEKEFEKEKGFNKAWIFENKVVVLDFIFDNNRIAFDIEINEKTQNVKIWMFCRNDKEYLKKLLKIGLEIKENNKILIFSNKDEKLLESIKNIKSFLGKITNEDKI